jgi:replicative DNA helicase
MDAYLTDLAARLDGAAPVTPGWSTGLPRLDDLIGGLRPGKLIVVVGESGGGKSTFGLAVTLAAMQAGARVGLYSLEMQEDELAERALAHDAQVDSLLLRAGQLTSDEWQRVQAAYRARQAQAPVRLVTGGGFSYRDIAAQARAWAVDGGLHLLAVDYLGLVRTAGRAGERVNELDSLINDLKALAMELNITVLTFSQLSKAGAGASPEDWKHYLRGSGAIEHAADVILAVAPQGDRPEEGTDPWPLQLAVTKQRGGPTGTIDALWWLAYSRIGEVTTRYA